MAYSKESIDTLKALVDPVDILTSIGGMSYSDLQIHESDVRCACPLHGGDNPIAFSWSKKYDGWKCFTKGCGGNEAHDVYGFIKLKLNCTFNEAVEKLASLYKFDLESNNQTGRSDYAFITEKIKSNNDQQRVKVSELITLKELPNFYNNSAGWEHIEKYIQLRNYPSLESINQYNLYPFLDSRNQLRVGIPSYSLEGQLVGVNARRLDGIFSYTPDSPKYYLTPGYKKENILFNLNNFYNNITQEYIIVVEGEFSCIRLNFWGWTNSVACLGNTLSDKQLATLTNLKNSNLLFLLERGEAARQGFIRTLVKLKDIAGKRYVHYAELPDKDPDEAPFLELQGLIESPKYMCINEFLNNDPYSKFEHS